MTDEITVIHNDTCPICAREVAVYRREAETGGLPIRFAGLAEAAATPAALSPDAAARRFHVVSGGRVYAGLDAFLVLWAALPRWRWLARAMSAPVVNPAAAFVYDRVAAPLLYALHRRRTGRG